METALNSRSRIMTGGVERMPNRAMLRAVGFTDEDFDKPIVGIASAGSEVTPCNVHLDELAALAKTGVKAAGGVPLKFNTFVVTDGEAMGHQMDAILGIGGSIAAGLYKGRPVDIVSAFEAVGGGIQKVMRVLLDAGLLHGDCITATGKTVEENLEGVSGDLSGQEIIHPLAAPVSPKGPISILKGNLAEEGAVLKTVGIGEFLHRGPARVFESEEEALKAILGQSIRKGDTVVIRNEGPRGGPGMREMLAPTSALAGAGLIREVALVTDGRFSGGSRGMIAYQTGALAKYARLVSSASKGAVTG